MIFKDMDEVPEERLKAELQRRITARQAGLCDYCGRCPSTPSCRFEDRHKLAESEVVFRLGSMVYHRRADLYAKIQRIATVVVRNGSPAEPGALLKYAPPYDQAAPGRWVAVADLIEDQRYIADALI